MSFYDDPIPELFLSKPTKRDCRKKNWTPEMIRIITEKYPVTFNKDLAAELGVSWRTLVRKARELNINKEPGFLEIRRPVISAMASKSRPENPTKGMKGWCIPGGEKYQYKPGHIPATKTDPEVAARAHKTRRETLRRDRIRMKLGLSRLTKINHRLK